MTPAWRAAFLAGRTEQGDDDNAAARALVCCLFDQQVRHDRYDTRGATRDALRETFMQRVRAKEPATPDYSDGRIAEQYRGRRRECARVLFDAMGIDWEDKPGRAAASFRNFEMFDAPHMAFLCMDDVFGKQSAADVGMYTQTLMLALTAHGLASCAQGTMAHYPDVVRDTFNLGSEIKVLFGLGFGYEDVNVPANSARTTRAPLAETVTFLG